MKKTAFLVLAITSLASGAHAGTDFVFRGSPHAISTAGSGGSGQTDGSGSGGSQTPPTTPANSAENEAGYFSIVGNTVRTKADTVFLGLNYGRLQTVKSFNETGKATFVDSEFALDDWMYVSYLGSMSNAVDTGSALAVSPTSGPDANGFYTYDLVYVVNAPYAAGEFFGTAVPEICSRTGKVENGVWVRLDATTVDFTFSVTTSDNSVAKSYVMPSSVHNYHFTYTRCDTP